MERVNGGQSVLNINECSRKKMEIKFKNVLIVYWNNVYIRDIVNQFQKGMYYEGCQLNDF